MEWRPWKWRATLESLFRSIVTHSGWWSVGFLVALIVIAALPGRGLDALTLYRQSPEWGKLVFQFAGVLLVVVFGIVPIVRSVRRAGSAHHQHQTDRGD